MADAAPAPAPVAEAPAAAAEEKPTEAKEGLAAAKEDSDAESEMEIPAAPPLHGHLYKQSPAMLRLRGWDLRFFLLADMKIMWWNNMNECLKSLDSEDTTALVRRVSTSDQDVSTTSKKGMVNFELAAAIVEADADSETTFTLRPVVKWTKGSTTDIRDDDKRVYRFDSKNSENTRAQWLELISEHIKKGDEMRSSGRARISECWEDVTISDEQLAAAARLVKKLEARKRR